MDDIGGIGVLIAIVVVLYIIYLIVVYIVLPILAIILSIGLFMLGTLVVIGLLSGIYVGITNFIKVLIDAHEKLP